MKWVWNVAWPDGMEMFTSGGCSWVNVTRSLVVFVALKVKPERLERVNVC